MISPITESDMYSYVMASLDSFPVGMYLHVTQLSMLLDVC